jgi:GNAT superfamily N-acetyltransferase
MDLVGLVLKMKRLQVRLDRQCHADGVIHKQFDGEPFGSVYLTMDPRSQATAASFNLNRVYLCGTEGGLAVEGLQKLIGMFTEEGVRRFFAWLSPGPEMESMRRWLADNGFERNRWVKYPTLVHDATAATAQGRTDLEIKEVSAAEVAAASDRLGETMWPDYARSAGKDGCYHYMAFDRARPVAIAALYAFEDIGYLAMASTAEPDRRRGAQQALIARRIDKARELGCAIVVSETLSVLEGSLRNLRRAGFREIYDKEVYEWKSPSSELPARAPSPQINRPGDIA